jgi:carbamoyl-phosphate synthase large subunit
VTPIRILFLGSGRRVSLLRFFRRAAEQLGVAVELHAADVDSTAPTWQIADAGHRVPSGDDPRFAPRVLELCQQLKIDLALGLIDAVLPALCQMAQALREVGTEPIISGEETIACCYDKLATFQHFEASGIPTPRTWDLADGSLPEGARFPLMIKPRFGNGSAGVHVLRDMKDLTYHASRVSRPCLQEMLTGAEFTFDVLTLPRPGVSCVVPRWRMQTRAGETSKGITCLEDDLIQAAHRVLAAMPDAYGPLNFQAFRHADGSLRFTEVNPRFGGGYVLSYHAGADFPMALLLHHLKREIPHQCLSPRDGVVLLRYDDEFITSLDALWAQGFTGGPLD